MTANTPTTAQALITQIRQRLNMENSQFVTDLELLSYLNFSLAEMDDIMVTTYEDYKITTVQATISNATDGYNYFLLPADFYKARAMDRQVNGVWMTLQPFMLPKRNTFSFPIINYTYGYLDVFYRISADRCLIIPATNSGATYQLWYVPQYINLGLTDTLSSYMDCQSWCEYAIVDVCIKVLLKQELIDEGSFWFQLKSTLKDRIINASKDRDAGPPKKRQNTRYDSEWNLGAWSR